MISVTRTDVGKLRVNNQDALIVLEQLYGVADGMGGHKGGEVASAGARDGLEKFLKGKTPDPRLLKTAVEAVNRRLYLRQREEAGAIRHGHHPDGAMGRGAGDLPGPCGGQPGPICSGRAPSPR